MRPIFIVPCLVTLICGSLHTAEMIPGLVGEYYTFPDGIEDFPNIPATTKPVIKRADKNINVDSTDDAWPKTQLMEHFMIRWTGVIRIPKDGKYTLYTESDDGSRLFVDGKQVVDNGGLHGMEEKSGEVQLTAGDHPLKVEFFQNEGGKGCKMCWSYTDVEKTIIPPTALYHSSDVLPAPAPLQPLPASSDRKPGLQGEYFQLGEDAGDRVPNLTADTKPAVKRVDDKVDALVGGDEPWPGTKLTSNYYIRWTGVVRAPKDGTYTFSVESDDGSWLNVGGADVVDNGGAHAMQEVSGMVDLKAGDHLLRLDFRQIGGDAGCKLSWTIPGGEKEIIPAKALYHPEK